MGQIQENVNPALKVHHVSCEKKKKILPENNQESYIEGNLEFFSVSKLY